MWARKHNNDETTKATRRKGMKRHIKKLRLEAIEAYGGKCNCCGELTPEFLHLDHVLNDGAEHRKELSSSKGGSIHTLRWAKKNGWPDRLQLMCHNCGMSEAFYGVCPHRNDIGYDDMGCYMERET